MAIRTENHDDLTKFRNRLWSLMDKNGYDTPQKLATSLYDLGLVSVKSKKEYYSLEEEIRKNAIGSIEKKIVKHLHASDMTKVQGEFIVAYCKHFHCSADYLFGLTEIQTANPDIRIACKVSGLSEPAITRLHEALDEEVGEATYLHKCFSQLLESDLFYKISFDWGSAYREARDCLKCEASVDAISEVLKDEDPSSSGYNIIAIKAKPSEQASQGHYAAYYGMLYKLAQDITMSLDALVSQQTKEDKVYEKELEQMKWQYQAELCKANGKPEPPPPDGEFHWHSHIII